MFFVCVISIRGLALGQTLKIMFGTISYIENRLAVEYCLGLEDNRKKVVRLFFGLIDLNLIFLVKYGESSGGELLLVLLGKE